MTRLNDQKAYRAGAAAATRRLLKEARAWQKGLCHEPPEVRRLARSLVSDLIRQFAVSQRKPTVLKEYRHDD